MKQIRKPSLILFSLILIVSTCSYAFSQSCFRDFDGSTTCRFEKTLIRKIASNGYYEAYFGINTSFDSEDRFVTEFTQGCGSDNGKLNNTGSDSNVVDDSDVQFFLDDGSGTNSTKYQKVLFQLSDETTFTDVAFKVPYSDEWTSGGGRVLKYRIVQVQFTPTTSISGLPFSLSSSDRFVPTGCPGYSGPVE